MEALRVVNGLELQTPNGEVLANFISQRLGSVLWSKQGEIVHSIAENKTTLVSSATGVGKTKVAGDAGLAWLFTGPYRCVVTTAPTARQVRDLLWKEIRKSVASAAKLGLPLGGELPPRAPELRCDDDWMAIGFSSSDAVNFQGWHSPGGTLFILDEALGVPDKIWAAIQGTLTGEHDRLLAIANPMSPEGEFFKLWRRNNEPGSLRKIQISAFDHPNVVHKRTIIPGSTTIGWIEERRKDWGEDSALWKARVLGEFPDSSENVLVPLSWVQAAIDRWHERSRVRDPDEPEGPGPLRGPNAIGLDVARYGNDKSVMAVATFGTDAVRVGRLGKAAGRSTMEIAGWAKDARKQLDSEALRIDGDGLGAGVVDRLTEQKVPNVVDMRAGTRAMDAARFVNARAEWAWSFREALRPDAPIPVELPPDDELTFQATSLRYLVRSDGRIQVESKEDWRKRTGRSSPDELDAVVMALARGYGQRRQRFHLAKPGPEPAPDAALWTSIGSARRL